jgi:hypothetical protein
MSWSAAGNTVTSSIYIFSDLREAFGMRRMARIAAPGRPHHIAPRGKRREKIFVEASEAP